MSYERLADDVRPQTETAREALQAVRLAVRRAASAAEKAVAAQALAVATADARAAEARAVAVAVAKAEARAEAAASQAASSSRRALKDAKAAATRQKAMEQKAKAEAAAKAEAEKARIEAVEKAAEKAVAAEKVAAAEKAAALQKLRRRREERSRLLLLRAARLYLSRRRDAYDHKTPSLKWAETAEHVLSHAERLQASLLDSLLDAPPSSSSPIDLPPDAISLRLRPVGMLALKPWHSFGRERELVLPVASAMRVAELLNSLSTLLARWWAEHAPPNEHVPATAFDALVLVAEKSGVVMRPEQLISDTGVSGGDAVLVRTCADAGGPVHGHSSLTYSARTLHCLRTLFSLTLACASSVVQVRGPQRLVVRPRLSRAAEAAQEEAVARLEVSSPTRLPQCTHSPLHSSHPAAPTVHALPPHSMHPSHYLPLHPVPLFTTAPCMGEHSLLTQHTTCTLYAPVHCAFARALRKLTCAVCTSGEHGTGVA
jgi:hypothetical protein